MHRSHSSNQMDPDVPGSQSLFGQSRQIPRAFKRRTPRAAVCSVMRQTNCRANAGTLERVHDLRSRAGGSSRTRGLDRVRRPPSFLRDEGEAMHAWAGIDGALRTPLAELPDGQALHVIQRYTLARPSWSSDFSPTTRLTSTKPSGRG